MWTRLQLPALIHSLLPISLFTINCDGRRSFLTQGGKPFSGLTVDALLTQCQLSMHRVVGRGRMDVII